MRAPLAVAIVGVAVLAAAILVETAPSDAQEQHGAFPVALTEGERGDGRNLAVRVADPRLADVVVLDGWRGTTTGEWLVLDATAAARSSDALLVTTLRIGELSFAGLDSGEADTLESTLLEPGLPWRGALLFELPADAAALPGADHATLRAALSSDPRLDSVLELEIDLTTLPHDAQVLVPSLERTTW
ncbi:MAG: hypothetical protein J0G30_11495 [Actinomycetales bacterium]|nr:hypothetical protein [Actinomycetales bacterium]